METMFEQRAKNDAKFGWLVGVTLALLTMSTGDAIASANAALEEVVVTAQKRAEDAQVFRYPFPNFLSRRCGGDPSAMFSNPPISHPTSR